MGGHGVVFEAPFQEHPFATVHEPSVAGLLLIVQKTMVVGVTTGEDGRTCRAAKRGRGKGVRKLDALRFAALPEARAVIVHTL